MMQADQNLQEQKKDKAKKLYELAISKFYAAVNIEPSDYKTVCKWANCLTSLSKAEDNIQKKKEYLNSAANKYLDVRWMKKVLFFWAEFYLSLQISLQIFAKAFQLKGTEWKVLYNWGNCLLEQANLALINLDLDDTQRVDEQKHFLKAAAEKYQKAYNANKGKKKKRRRIETDF